MIKQQLVIIFFIGFILSTSAQIDITESFLNKEFPKEQVYLHINSTLLFTGEQLQYKFYGLESDTGKLSSLSKIGWVELVNNKGEVLLQHKVKLKNGQGFSDFFIHSNLKSGSYKIVAYTNWMLNAKGNYFMQDINIINPYLSTNTGIEKQKNNKFLQERFESNNGGLNFNLNKSRFGKREKVILELENPNNLSGNFSLSVRRLGAIDKPERLKSTTYKRLYTDIVWNFKDTIFLPEVRGALFKANIKIENKELLSGKNMIISSPGEEGQLRIVSIDRNGNFSFTLNEIPKINEFIFQIENDRKLKYNINLLKHPHPNYDSLLISPPFMASNYRDDILERSINIQIENAYNNIKKDHFHNPGANKYFFEKELITYNLEDYNSFPDIAQTFTEIIKFGRIRENNMGVNIFLVRSKKVYDEFEEPALLIVDGVVVQDHEKLIAYNPRQIKSISVLRDRLFLGPSVYQGAVIVSTKEGDFPSELAEKGMIINEIKIPQKPKTYYSPNYSAYKLDRIPDYRYQLLWNPIIKLIEKEIIFYTSDLNGKFEINLEGFTSEGKPVSISTIFEVD
ncbi:hypothetical protein DET49_1453 [Salegentibacter sp. 24]|uniref:hypothetical protein n=1 Tax=Salegentibacter sp. 24 TaxID=2183986 RepID=UPI00105CD78B|nr:hypothetical protein [Salegentibacter sp. 24]TDN78556.1 hypothetical protein DET49_1453 [Salegentibacter sp. 24]